MRIVIQYLLGVIGRSIVNDNDILGKLQYPIQDLLKGLLVIVGRDDHTTFKLFHRFLYGSGDCRHVSLIFQEPLQKELLSSGKYKVMGGLKQLLFRRVENLGTHRIVFYHGTDRFGSGIPIVFQDKCLVRFNL